MRRKVITVGNVEANNKADALAKIKEVYAPDIGGKPHENVSFELITPQEFYYPEGAH
jgi:hypothetical protein